MAQTNGELEHSKGVYWPWNLDVDQASIEHLGFG
jgi:hypothetical protein